MSTVVGYQGYTPFEAVVSEMSQDGLGSLVPVDEKLLQEIVDPEDNNPVFVTIEVLNEGKSNNSNVWNKEHLLDIAQQINSKRPNGYQGHISKEERSYKYPDAQTIWLGAVVREVNGKLRLLAKGYVLPYATKLRSYLRSAKAAGKNIAVSVSGKAYQAVRTAQGIIPNGFNLESIDWARPGSEGVANMGLFAITQEMTDDSNADLNKETHVNREETIKSLKKSDLEELNPTLISEMTDDAVQAKEAELATDIQEMTEIKEITGASDEKPAKVLIQEMVSELSELRELKVDKLLGSQVNNAQARGILRPLVIAEMRDDKSVDEAVEAVLGSDDGKYIIQEMIDTPPVVQPTINRQQRVAERRFTKVKK